MTRLPERLAVLVDEVVDGAGLTPEAAREARSDLEQHLLDGLAGGRSVQELVERFGDPGAAARMLARSPAPARGVTSSGAGFGLLASIRDDVRHALRGLVKAPTLAVTVTLVLALGIGANAVVFTVLNELLLRPLPVSEPTTLVDVWADIPGGNSFTGFAYRDFEAYRDRNDVLDDLVAFTGRRLEVGEAAGPEVVVGTFVSPGYFSMLGVAATLGSLSFAGSPRFGDPPVVVLSHGLWRTAFGADPGVVGRDVRLQGRPVRVVGVAPEGFAGHFIGFPSDLWLPLSAAVPLIEGFDPDDRTQKGLEMIGRRAEGASVARVRGALMAIAEDLEQSHPEVNRGHRLGVTPTTGLDHSLQSGVTAFVLVLTVVSILVLVIACLNVGSVLLVRAMARDREIAVRLALGAGRARLLRQLLTESTVLVLLGALMGVGLALRLNAGLSDALSALAAGIGLDLTVDWRVLTLTAVVALVASGLAVVAPALHLFRKAPASVLRARDGASAAGSRTRTVLVVAQVAVSVVLVIGTGLFVRALVEGGRVSPGFDADRVATFALTVSRPEGPTSGPGERVSRPEGVAGRPGAGPDGDHRARVREVVEAVRALRDVEGAVAASAPPIGVGRSPVEVQVPGVAPPPNEPRHLVDARVVGPRYLGTIGLRLRSGRDLTRADVDGDAAVVVVSRAFAARFLPNDDPVGKTVTVAGRPVQVVGVVDDARYVVQDDTPDPLVYLPGHPVGPTLSLTYRSVDPIGAAEAVDAAVRSVLPGHRRIRPRTGRDVLDDALVPQRLGSLIVGAMGLAALLLAGVGLYGLVQFAVSRDTHELGVRRALGGGDVDLLRVVARKGLAPTAVGVAVGVAAALVLSPFLSAFLGRVPPRDPPTYAAVVLTFGVVAVVASWLPGRRALAVDPVRALGAE